MAKKHRNSPPQLEEAEHSDGADSGEALIEAAAVRSRSGGIRAGRSHRVADADPTGGIACRAMCARRAIFGPQPAVQASVGEEGQ